MTKPKTTRRKKLGIGCGGVVLFLVILFFALPTRQMVFAKRWEGVASIAAQPEYKDNARIQKAHAQPAVSAYALPIRYQSNGSVCGPTSLSNVFMSFGDANATPENVLEGTGKCSTGMCFMGLSLEELAEVAKHRPGYSVTILRDLSLADFRAQVQDLSNPSRRYVLNFDRGPLFGGKSGGHHSPLGGYLADEDLVLVLDVNAKFEPWLVKTERLFAAMDTIDSATDKKRGLLRIEKQN